MSDMEVYRRKVLAKRRTRVEATAIVAELSARNPAGRYAVEYTPVINQHAQWRVVKLSIVPSGTPDVHPYCECVRESQRSMIRGEWSEWSEGRGYDDLP